MAKKHGHGHEHKRGMGGMIREDRSAPSNLPMEYMNNAYPTYDYINAPVSDDMAGIDMQIDNAVRTAKAQLSKKKY